jgi:hypothetical protein
VSAEGMLGVVGDQEMPRVLRQSGGLSVIIRKNGTNGIVEVAT